MTTTPSDMLCFALHSTALAVHSAYVPILEPLGLTYPQYLVLAALAGRDGQTVGELGRSLRMDTNTLTPLLKRIERSGLLTRQRDQTDERQVRVSLTTAGHDLAQQASGVPAAFAEKTGLGADHLADLRDVLTMLRDRLKPART